MNRLQAQHIIESRKMHLQDMDKRPYFGGEYDQDRQAEKALCKREIKEAKNKVKTTNKKGEGNMKVGTVVQASELKKYVGMAAEVLIKKTTIPILACVRLRSSDKGGFIHVSSTDLDLFFEGCVVNEAGNTKGGIDVCVDGKALMNTLKNMKGLIHLNQNGNKLDMVTESNSKISLLTIPPDEFPPVIKGTKVGAVRYEEEAKISDALRFVLPAMSEDETRYVLNSVFFDVDNNVVVATDGRRLHMSKVPCKGKIKGGVALPAKTATLIHKWLGKECVPDVNMVYHKYTNDKKEEHFFVDITVGDCTLISKCVEGMYPNYKQVIPDTYDHAKAVVKTDVVTQGIKTLPLPTRKDGPITKWVWGKNSLRIKYEHPDNPSGDINVPVVSSKQVKDIMGVNPYFMIDALQNCGNEEACIHYGGLPGHVDILSPIVVEADNNKAVIMPIRLNT